MMVVSAARFGQPVRPTNLHINKALYPNDAAQPRLPNPAFLDAWLNEQIKFDKTWEQRVCAMILHNLSQLSGRPLTTASELHVHRKSLAKVAV